MKGIIFNLLEGFLTERLGEEKSDELIESCSLKTREPFVGPGSYPDEDLLAIVDRAVEVTGMIEGVAEHYRSPIRYRQRQCMMEGEASCEFELEFEPARVEAT